MANIDIAAAAAELIETSVIAVLSHVPAGEEKKAVDSVLDKLQGLVDGTSTPLDDAVIEPIITRLRATFGVQ